MNKKVCSFSHNQKHLFYFLSSGEKVCMFCGDAKQGKKTFF